jgi:hypothetical protein
MRRRTCDPAVEISGLTLRAYVDNAKVSVVRPIFEKHGMAGAEPDKWYPLQPLLDVLFELSIHFDSVSNLVAIGVKIAEYGVEPSDMKTASLPYVLEHWEQHLYANVRNGDIGHIYTEKVTDTLYRVTQQNIFPDDLCYGLAYGFARSRLPLGTNFKVWYESFDYRIDRGDADKTVICVSWEPLPLMF